MEIEIFDLEGMPLTLVRGLLLTAAAVLWTIALVRMVGLRGFSKMTSFDFVTTIATGSLIAQAGTRARWDEFAQAMIAIAAVFLVQWLLAKARLQSDAAAAIIRNEPLLLMFDGQFLDEAMRDSRVSRSNLLEKIRNSSANSLDEVQAVVLETTGDLSVLIGDKLDPKLMEGVHGYDQHR